MDPRIREHAEIIVNHSIDCEDGDHVVIDAHPVAEDLTTALVEAVADVGGHPLVIQERLGQRFRRAYLNNYDGEFETPEHTGALYEAMDAYIAIKGSDNETQLSDVDTETKADYERAYEPVRETRLNKPWNLTLYPAPANAQVAEMATEEYENFVWDAILKDWDAVREHQQEMADRIGPAVTGLMAAVSAGGASGSPPTGHGAPPAAGGDPAPAADAGGATPSPDPGPAAPTDAGAGAPREPAPSAAAYRLRRVEPEGEADCRMTDFLRLPMALAPAEPLPGGEMAADPRLCGIVLVPAGAGEDAPPGLRLVPPRDPGLAPLPPGFAAMAGTGIAPWRLTRPVRVDVIGAGGSAVHRFTLVPRP